MTAVPLAILGAGGHAKVVIDIVERMGVYRIAGVFDDDPAKWGTQVLGYEVLGGMDEFLLHWRSRCPQVVIGIGGNRVRQNRRLLGHAFGHAAHDDGGAVALPGIGFPNDSTLPA